MLESLSAFWAEYGDLLLEGTRDTLIMIGVSTVFAYLIGLPLGVLLSISQPHGIWPHKWFNRILGWIINVGRSLPFIILMIAIMDFTKLIVGTKLGVPGAIVPLVVSAAPFIARMVETSLAEVDAGVVEAAQSMGASRLQIVWKVYLPEAVPSLILGASISIITLLGYTAIAGAVGAGGLGDLAIRYGYQRSDFFTGGDHGVNLGRLCQSIFFIQRHIGFDLILDSVDALIQSFSQFHGADFFINEFIMQFMSSALVKIHSSSSLSYSITRGTLKPPLWTAGAFFSASS